MCVCEQLAQSYLIEWHVVESRIRESERVGRLIPSKCSWPTAFIAEHSCAELPAN